MSDEALPDMQWSPNLLALWFLSRVEGEITLPTQISAQVSGITSLFVVVFVCGNLHSSVVDFLQRATEVI